VTQPILKVEGLMKNFGSFRAVDGISFEVPPGKVIGFLGPNGAGKTTTIHMLLGITLSNGGTIKYFGKEFPRYRKEILSRINFSSSFNDLQGRISVEENLLVFAKLYGVANPKKKINELVDYFQCKEFLPKRFWDLSQGQKTRVNLMKALINDPEILLLDEPTASLDPDIADKTLTLIEELKKSRRLSILYTSHNMAEVTRICDEVIFLEKGKIVAHDTPLGLTKRIASAQLHLMFDGEKALVEKFLTSEKQRFSFPSEFTVKIDTEEKLIPQLIFGINKSGIEITDIEVKKPTLEDVFLKIARGKTL
jgi:ABC-2 type transport system ATP-binding protein